MLQFDFLRFCATKAARGFLYMLVGYLQHRSVAACLLTCVKASRSVFCDLKSSVACRFPLPVLQRRALSIRPCSSLSATCWQHRICCTTAEPQGQRHATYIFGILLGML